MKKVIRKEKSYMKYKIEVHDLVLEEIDYDVMDKIYYAIFYKLSEIAMEITNREDFTVNFEEYSVSRDAVCSFKIKVKALCKFDDDLELCFDSEISIR